ncbi:type II toxin-antitoxin system mRNA interferase toxin, RelE/StbE family [Candidatus Daviesbacteria bacterium]|nr:type II toxin-antitoxin system mRNA interferase toxin, RelE/StbE family [Candidatus Daviesbacteria bacterium]
MKIRFGKKFRKQFQKAPVQIRNTFETRLKLFVQNPFNPILNNHSLTGKRSRYKSINVTGDWRAIYSEQKNEAIVIFELLGTNSQLYR